MGNLNNKNEILFPNYIFGNKNNFPIESTLITNIKTKKIYLLL